MLFPPQALLVSNQKSSNAPHTISQAHIHICQSFTLLFARGIPFCSFSRPFSGFVHNCSIHISLTFSFEHVVEIDIFVPFLNLEIVTKTYLHRSSSKYFNQIPRFLKSCRSMTDRDETAIKIFAHLICNLLACSLRYVAERSSHINCLVMPLYP